MHCRIEQLFGILLAHLLLGLRLLLLLLLVLLLFLLFLFFFFLFLVVFPALVLLVLLLLSLAEREVVARLVVGGIVAEAFLIGFDGLGIHLVLLANPAQVVIGHRLAFLVRFELSGVLKLHDGRRVFLLHHHRAAEVVDGLRIALVGRDGLLVFHFGLGVLLLMEELVALPDVLAVGLGPRLGRNEEEGTENQE